MRFKDVLERLNHIGNEVLQAARVNKVRVSPERGTWTIYLGTKSLIASQDLQALVQTIIQQVEGLIKVDIIVEPEQPETTLNEIIKNQLFAIQNYLQEECPQCPFEEMKLKADGSRVVLETDDIEQWQAVIKTEACQRLEQWFKESYHLAVLVGATCSGVETAASSTLSLRAGENVVATSAPAKLRRKKRGKIPPNIAENQIISIYDLQEGMKGVIQGSIISKEIRELKGGRKVAVCHITDFTDTITMKIFDCDEIVDCNWIRAIGSVRYDNFERDEVFFADRIQKIPPMQRKDQSESKRVELHLHTKMSTMDAITNIKDLMETAQRFGHKAVAITDHGTLQAFPEAYQEGQEYGIKVLLGLEGYLVDSPKQERSYHIVLLARNREGLKNLYKLVSRSYLDHFYRTPRILRKDLEECRSGLLVGSACERGEIISTYLAGVDRSELQRIASFYDYLEIQPLANNEFLVRDKIVKTREDLMQMNRTIVELGKEIGRPVVATGDVHFLEPEHAIYRMILQAGKGFDDAENQAPLYYRTTDEMLEEFKYLGPETAYQVVVTNPNEIAASCEELRPVPEGHFSPKIEGAAEQLTELVRTRAYQVYKEPLPELVAQRIERELNSITTHGFSELYLVAYHLVKKSNEDGYLVGSRGSVGSSLAAFLIGITEVNPLPPHYLCSCGYNAFYSDGTVHCGVDLPPMNCPQCGRELKRDGFDIPFETFLGFEGDKVPDIDLNFSGDYQLKAHQMVEDLFGKENVFRAGTISTIAEKTAFGFVKKFEEENGKRFRKPEVERLVKGITGAKRTTGQHPGGLMLVPGHMDILEFTPLQHPAEDANSEVITTHFDYEALSGVLVKLDILGHDDPTMIRSLEELTGLKATNISLDEPKTMALFSGVESLGVKPEDIRSQIGTYGVPEFNTRFVRQMLEVTRPQTFSELVRISGLSHGANVWNNNAHDLIKNGIATLNEVIATRDDIMLYLISKGLDKSISFKIMENVRRGRGLTNDEVEAMQAKNIPQWYIDSCHKIKYMFPKAHAVAYVMMAYRIAFYKVYFPQAFYASYFSIRAQDFDPVILEGYDSVRRRIEEIEKMGTQAPAKDRNLLPVLEVALEMWARGLKFYPVDLYESDAVKFKIHHDGLLLPFSALPGVGETAARHIAEAKAGGAFVSVEDLQQRGKVNKTVLEILERAGCLDDLPASSQVSLFG